MGKQIKVGKAKVAALKKIIAEDYRSLNKQFFELERSQIDFYLQRINAEGMCGLYKNKSDFLSQSVVIS